ncbi:MAG: DUF456 domain-containing protein [Desulfobacteraceae bacterium]|nr:DUF456 domain-containing protein [Desulfobacteraceae bacterium]
MEITGIIATAVLIIFCLAGFILIPLGMPGTFVIIAGAVLYNLITWSMAISAATLAALLALALVGEILEYILGMKLAQRRGTSRPAVIGAIVGGIVGTFAGIPVPVLGPLIGLFAGVFIGAFLVELVSGKNFSEAFHSAIAAFYGRLGAVFAKTLVGAAMILLLFV